MNSILIVDDEASARDTLEALLFQEGYHLAFASCGQEALQKAQNLTPSLILLDIMMPAMDGFEVCRRLRAMPLLAEVPVIMISALDDRESRLQGIEAGADDFISKPFDRAELRARVRTIIRLNRYRRLHMERTRFEWVVQQAEDGYLIVNEDDEVLYANSHARLFFNLPSHKMDQTTLQITKKSSLGTFLELARKQYHLEPSNVWSTWPEQAPASSSSPRYLIRPETDTSEAFWLQVDIFNLPSEPKMDKIVRVRDVTSQVKVQHTQRGFHSVICHKLRTPLVGILGSLEFLARHISGLTPSEVHEFAEMAFTSAQRLHSEIEDILQYLTIPDLVGAGPHCPLTELITIITQLSHDINLDTITIILPDTLQKFRLTLSCRAIELIFWEILENAIKFHPKQTPTVRVTAMQSGDLSACLQIQDDGISLSPEQLSQMWVPYYQGEKYSTGETSGMGLGLAMVATLVWEVGGTCRAYNRDKEPGIIIELELPLQKPAGA